VPHGPKRPVASLAWRAAGRLLPAKRPVALPHSTIRREPMQSEGPASTRDGPTPTEHLTAIGIDFSQYFVLFLLLGVLVLFVFMTKGFFIPIVLAGVFCSLFYPLYRHLVRWTRGRTNLSAAITCVIMLLGLLIPLYLLVNVVIIQAIEFYKSVGPELEALLASGGLDPAQLADHPLVRRFGLDQGDWGATVKQGITIVSSSAGKVINATSRGTFAFLSTLLITLFTMFYFFRDGERIVAHVMDYLPMGDDYKQQIAARFKSIARATIKGTLILGFIQGTLGGITLWIFGFKAAVMWGMVMVILSLLPLVGTYVVLVPAALYEIATGNVGSGIAILVVTVVVISNVDNVLRPRLVGRDAGMHDLVIFFSTLGGIGFFGIMGFVVGPVVASLLVTLLDIYSLEFHGHIKREGVPSVRAEGR
jgi:predicted PurR-regulated permease PerM